MWKEAPEDCSVDFIWDSEASTESFGDPPTEKYERALGYLMESVRIAHKSLREPPLTGQSHKEWSHHARWVLRQALRKVREMLEE